MQPSPRLVRRVGVVALLSALLAPPAQAIDGPDAREAWEWPVSAFSMSEPYRQPAHRYAEGHRGVDVRPASSFDVTSPADGVIAFSGMVADRPLVTIEHGGGLVSTLEPVVGTVRVGSAVERGEIVGALSVGGHARPGDLHIGLRLDGEYINPLLLLGDVPRAVLLPCC